MASEAAENDDARLRATLQADLLALKAELGASLRLRSGSHVGPRHELHAGSGSGSQDGLVSVLGGPAPATEVLVRWPGGKETVSSVPAGATEIRVRPGGQVETVGR